MMRESVMHKLDARDGDGHSFIDDDRFEEVFKNAKVRIIKVKGASQTSKRYSADPRNRLCDAPGSWYCPGQLPPGLKALFTVDLSTVQDPADRKEAVSYQKRFTARAAMQRERDVPKPNGPGIPQGSYLGSCRGCSLSNAGATLSCTHCEVPGSPSDRSEVILTPCGGRAINNIHGELQCDPEPNAPDIPKGPYEGSCKGCKLVGPWLKCSHCGTAEGKVANADYDTRRCVPPEQTLDNQDGTLVCIGDIPSSSDAPNGPYQGSCKGCRLLKQGAELVCSHCSQSSRRQLVARIQLPCQGEIDNRDGRLECV